MISDMPHLLSGLSEAVRFLYLSQNGSFATCTCVARLGQDMVGGGKGVRAA